MRHINSTGAGVQLHYREKFMDWKQKAVELKFTQGKSWTETSKEIHETYFDGEDYTKVHEKVRGYLRSHVKYNKENSREEVVGIIGDTHFPFCHPNYIYFLEDTFRKNKVTKIVHIGDLCDNHAISRWQKEADSYGANQEYELALKDVQLYTKVFPKVTLLLGNHCKIPERQAATLGMPSQFLKSTKELWDLPKGWEVTEQLILNNVIYEHGINAMGVNGAINKAVVSMSSCVIGHSHSFGGCQYRSNYKDLIFGLNVGCGIDVKAYAFRYGKYNKHRETLGCGIVYNSSNAIFVPMGDKFFRSK